MIDYRSNPNNSELVYFSDVFDNVTSSSFNASLPNKIIVHGYNADMNLDVVQNIKTGEELIFSEGNLPVYLC